MDQLQNEEPQAIPERRTRRKPTAKARIHVPEFLTRIGEDVRWYYDVRLWSPLILLLLILALVLPGRGKKQEAQEIPVETVEVQPSTETTPPRSRSFRKRRLWQGWRTASVRAGRIM